MNKSNAHLMFLEQNRILTSRFLFQVQQQLKDKRSTQKTKKHCQEFWTSASYGIPVMEFLETRGAQDYRTHETPKGPK